MAFKVHLPEGWEDRWRAMRDELMDMRVADLRQLCRDEGISQGQDKHELVGNIVAHRRLRVLEALYVEQGGWS